MKFFEKVKLFFNKSFDDIIKQYLSGDDIILNDTILTETSALKYSVLFACFRVLAETFASVPIFEYRKTSNDDRESTNETGLYDIFHGRANDEMSSYNWKESSMYQLCAGGNAVSLRQKNFGGGIAGLYPIEWQRVKIDREKETRKLIYIVDNKETYYRNDVFHLPGPSTNGIIGMSIIEYASRAIKLGKSYEEYGIKFYENGALASGIFKHPTFLNDEAWKRLKIDLEKNYHGLVNAGKPMILEDGMDFKELNIKPIDAQLIESKKVQIEDVCRFCRVPLHLVQNLDKATNNNIEHQSLEFAMYTMLPHFKRAEECINTQLLTQKQRNAGYYLEFNMNALLRGDAKSMAEAFAIGRQWGWLSVNDIRRMFNLNRIENGDIYLQPMNMIEAGKEVDNVQSEIRKEIDNLIARSR